MDGSNMGDFDKRMEEMMKRFGGLAGPDSSFDAFDSPVVGEYDWQENEKEKILKIRGMKIENNNGTLVFDENNLVEERVWDDKM